MKTGLLAAIFAIAGLLATAAWADDIGRYQMGETENGIVRLDTVTGELTYCKQDGPNLICDGSVADQKQLTQRIRELSERVDRLEQSLKTANANANRIPSDEELDRSFSIMEKFFDHFMGFVDEMEKRERKSDKPLPQAT